MAVSQNGFSANDPSLIAPYLIPGTNVRLRLRKGPVSTVLGYVAERFDNVVEDIDTANTFHSDCSPGIRGADPSPVYDDWGYAFRPVRGQTAVLSNHASGTAIDLNATQHPRGVKGTFTAQQVSRIHEILDELKDPRTGRRVVRWGGDYENAPVDAMHFEVDAATDAVRRVAAIIIARRGATARAAAVARARAAAKRAAAIIAARKAQAAAAAAAALLAAWIATGHHGPVPRGWQPTPKPTASVTATSSPGPTATSTPTPSATPTVTPPKTPVPPKHPASRQILSRPLSFTPGHKPMSGPDVGAVQRLVGMTGALVDDRYGPATVRAVAMWQRRHHLRADGVFGRASARAAGWRWE